MFGMLQQRVSSAHLSDKRHYVPFSNPLISTSFAASSSFLKSLVFCARSFRCTVESLWYWTISDAVLSRFGIMDVRSMSVERQQEPPTATGRPYFAMLI